jgi:hypothetical protein
MNTLKDRIRSTKAQFRIAVKQYNQAARVMERLKRSLEQLEKKDELATTQSKAKHANRGRGAGAA